MTSSDEKSQLRYRRVLLKLSGEALVGPEKFGINTEILGRIADEIREVSDLGVTLAIGIGGGNIFRGVAVSARGTD